MQKNVRLVEWSVVAVVVLVLVGTFGYQLQVMQGQAERGAILANLGALRTAFILEHLRQAVHATQPEVAKLQHNPFLLLEQLPANYAGEFGIRQIDAAAPGSWVYDPECMCIGYRPQHPQWLESPPGTHALWFRIGSAAGPLSIAPMNEYVWQGQSLE